MRTQAKQSLLRQSECVVVAAVLAMAAATDGMAQQLKQQQPQSLQQGQQQPPQSRWTKLCGKVKVAAEGQPQAPQDAKQALASQDVNVCQTFQERLNNKDGRLVA